jgi:hypothetical protein
MLQSFNYHASQLGTEKSWTQSNRNFNTIYVIKLYFVNYRDILVQFY